VNQNQWNGNPSPHDLPGRNTSSPSPRLYQHHLAHSALSPRVSPRVSPPSHHRLISVSPRVSPPSHRRLISISSASHHRLISVSPPSHRRLTTVSPCVSPPSHQRLISVSPASQPANASSKLSSLACAFWRSYPLTFCLIFGFICSGKEATG
jgi:hypothetical protein